MSRLTRRSLGLPGLFLVATLLPAAALAWLGWQLVEQDRGLERQRVQDLVESSANGVTAALERELGAIERNLGSLTIATGNSSRADAAVAVRVNRHGSVTPIGGPPFMHELAAPSPRGQPPDSTWTEGEQLEFTRRDLAAAIQIYRALGRSTDPDVRAGALIRLARALKSSGRPDEALDAYAGLAAIPDARILGDPADLMARWARVELLAALNRQETLRTEAAALDADVRNGRWRLDRTTALTYAQALRPYRSDADEGALTTRIILADAVASVWNEWQTRPPTSPLGNGRRTIRVDGNPILVVWREAADKLLLFAASSEYLARIWRDVLNTPNVAVALIDSEGQPIVGEIPSIPIRLTASAEAPVVERPDPASPSTSEIRLKSDPTFATPDSAFATSPPSVVVTRHESETRLPWTLRVAATSTPAEIAATGAARRRIIVAVLMVIAVLIPSTGYLVMRAVQKDLALARQQAAFVSAVSHEFRSPLTSLAHLTSLLRSDFQPSEERRRQYYEVLAHESERLRRFVETLLDFGRMQAGATRYHLEAVDAGAIVSGIVEEFRRHAAAGAHPVSLVTADLTARIAADREALGRAIWNLLENAAKYSPAEKPIIVRLEENEGRVTIRVSDQGPGIPAAEQPFIFDQFYRGAAAIESAVKGTGVGLAMVRHIVRGHQGEVQVDSEPGSGSTFSIVLPPAPPESTAMPERRIS